MLKIKTISKLKLDKVIKSNVEVTTFETLEDMLNWMLEGYREGGSYPMDMQEMLKDIYKCGKEFVFFYSN